MRSIDTQFATRRQRRFAARHVARRPARTPHPDSRQESGVGRRAGCLRRIVAGGARGADLTLAGHAAPRGERPCEARMLFFGRISAGPLFGECTVLPGRRPVAGSARGLARHGPRFGRHCRAGGRSRPRQRRLGAARGMLPGFAGDAAIPGRGLRHPLRLRYLHAGHRARRRAARGGEQLAAPAQRVGNAARQRALHRALRRADPGRGDAGAGRHGPLGRHQRHLRRSDSIS